MLHPINPPDSAPNLERILEFQEQLLDFASAHGAVEYAELVARFGAEIADWLRNNHALMLRELGKFASESEADRRAVVAAFQNDRQFFTRLGDPTVTFQLGSDSRPAFQHARAWLAGFYDQFSRNGFLPVLFGGNGDALRKIDWLNSFRKTNPQVYVCVTCDGMMREGVRWDHYLPREKYPAFSIHPRNLLPTCQICNHDKDNRDPLDGHTTAQIYLPYRLFVRDTACLTFEENSHGEIQARFLPTSSAAETPIQLQTFSDLYRVPQQWNENLPEIDRIARGKLRDRIDILREDKKSVDPDALRVAVEKTCNQMQAQWGEHHYMYPATEWLRWMVRNKFHRLCQDFCDRAN